MSQLRSTTLESARPRLVDAIVRHVDGHRLRSQQIKERYRAFDRRLMSEIRAARAHGDFCRLGPDRLIAIAEALDIDTQPLLYPPAERRAA
ncbi:hypothetical protein [Devosia nitrariae]|uniref:Uncharacterized protein n=1 Tax=Devosia nitrariae TaxID=2071872 RepID=A0ABQ5W1J0_9HYPH|nr:hypothetical protein [Devosia nitrariae]GLQ53588.1 hypothetical protein GCM10010862_08470 [Devosia nitrariae]